jgi:hypothetical protein
MIEPEMAFCDLEGNMNVAEDMIKYVINYVLEECPEEMEFFNKFIDKGLLERLDNIVNSDFERITYTEAVDILKKSGSHEKVGECRRNYFSVMPAIKWYWTNKNSFGLYSKAAAGAAFLNNTDEDFTSGKSKDDSKTYFMFQLSFIGAEFGRQLRGFAELGIGDQGFAQAGIRYKF